MTHILVDKQNVIYRAYYSSNSERNIHPWMGIVRYINILRNCSYRVRSSEYYEEPIEFIFADEGKKPLERTLYDETYKIGRTLVKDDEFIKFKKGIKTLHKIIKIHLISVDGLEADDIIASLVISNKTKQQVILSNDKDFRQLLGMSLPGLVIYEMPGRFYTKCMFKKEYGFDPERFIFYKALIGDLSDGIKGVTGWGPVNAKKHVSDGSWMTKLKDKGQTDEYWHAMELIRFRFKDDIEATSSPIAISEKEVAKVMSKFSDLYENKEAGNDICVSLFQLEESTKPRK